MSSLMKFSRILHGCRATLLVSAALLASAGILGATDMVVDHIDEPGLLEYVPEVVRRDT